MFLDEKQLLAAIVAGSLTLTGILLLFVPFFVSQVRLLGVVIPVLMIMGSTDVTLGLLTLAGKADLYRVAWILFLVVTWSVIVVAVFAIYMVIDFTREKGGPLYESSRSSDPTT